MNAIDRQVRALMRRVSEEAILPRYQNLSSAEIDQKAADDFVTVADHEAEEMLSEGLAAIDGSLDIVGEEASHADSSVMDRLSGDCWIIDPLDGTHNFAHGNRPSGSLSQGRAGAFVKLAGSMTACQGASATRNAARARLLMANRSNPVRPGATSQSRPFQGSF